MKNGRTTWDMDDMDLHTAKSERLSRPRTGTPQPIVPDTRDHPDRSWARRSVARNGRTNPRVVATTRERRIDAQHRLPAPRRIGVVAWSTARVTQLGSRNERLTAIGKTGREHQLGLVGTSEFVQRRFDARREVQTVNAGFGTFVNHVDAAERNIESLNSRPTRFALDRETRDCASRQGFRFDQLESHGADRAASLAGRRRNQKTH